MVAKKFFAAERLKQRPRLTIWMGVSVCVVNAAQMRGEMERG
jgi:hypothetical protein